ncbi:hypothetical protein T492DRAFT_913370 [Pavlovales sp. CCMP2436]|nr:hypothetical protein T492DRAFT_913370 [Pavlovales sp. CCMP2436]
MVYVQTGECDEASDGVDCGLEGAGEGKYVASTTLSHGVVVVVLTLLAAGSAVGSVAVPSVALPPCNLVGSAVVGILMSVGILVLVVLG